MATKTVVWCTFSAVGFHCWPEAPEDVAYLQNDHRHIFHFKVGVFVNEDNREVEFHTLKNISKKQLAFGTPYGYLHGRCAIEFGAASCEMIAKALGEALIKNEYLSVAFVEVSEDGENGATVHFNY